MFNRDWKARALAAEGANAILNAAIDQAKEGFTALEARLSERAALVSIVREGRKVRFIHVRNGKSHIIEMYGTWDDDVDGWKAALLGPIGKDDNASAS